MRLLTVAIAASLAAAITIGAPAQAATSCRRTQYGASCSVYFQNFSADLGHYLRFAIRNDYKPDANQVTTNYGWLDGTNDRSHRTWSGHLGRVQNRFRFKYWRACVPAWRPKWACTPWAYQGPPRR